MVLKFKVWRLQRERHRIGHEIKNVFVLRDKHGYIRKIAKSREEEISLVKWFERYNVKARLDQLLAVRRLKEHVRRIKQNVRERGFTKQLSIYGITKNLDSGKRVYRRYEIFKADKWTQQEVTALHNFFKRSPPTSQAGVFIYHNNKLYVVGFDKVTQKGTETLGYAGERRESFQEGTNDTAETITKTNSLISSSG